MLIDSIFNYLFNNKDYYYLVFPKLKEKLFIKQIYKVIYKKIKEYNDEYSIKPTIKDIALLVDTDASITEEETKEVIKKLKEISGIETTDNFELMKNETEEWLLHRSCELAVIESSEILEKDQPKGKMVDLMKEAVSISLESNLGLEYGIDAEKQYDFYTREEEVMKTNLEALDLLLGGGYRRKALYLYVGKTNIGKTLWLCFSAGGLVKNGYNVAYYTAEMAEEAITKRIDANILNLQMKQLSIGLEKDYYLSRVNKNYIELPSRGRLFVKEYPTGFGTRENILQNLNDLRIKEGFIPDAIVVDSVNIFASSRLPASLLGNTYVYQKAVAEEFRAIGVEKDIAVVSATQLNRESSNKSADNMDTTGTADCVSLDTEVEKRDSIKCRIDELVEGDEILGPDGFVKVSKIWPRKIKRKYRIKTKSGKILYCSSDHKIMTSEGLKSIKSGLSVGDKVSSK